MFDVIIKNGTIIDGSLSPSYLGDIGIKDGFIKKIGDLSSFQALEYIDASNLVVCPGFIDVHSHNDLVCFMDMETKTSKLFQGVTTELVGQCGLGPVPNIKKGSLWHGYVKGVIGDPNTSWNFPTFKEYIKIIEKEDLYTNYMSLITHGAIRASVMEFKDCKASKEEIDKMKNIASEAMENGAFGMSFGLQYLPGIFSHREELIELFKTVGEYKGIVMIHLKNHNQYMGSSLKEVIDIAKTANVKLHISHMRSYRKEGWGTSPIELLSILEEGRAKGVNITFDQHYYTAGSTLLTQLLPPWMTEGNSSSMLERLQKKENIQKLIKNFGNNKLYYEGWDDYASIAGWENIVISYVNSKEYKSIEGLSLDEISKAWNMHPYEAVAKILIKEKGGVCIINKNIFSSEDIISLMNNPYEMVGSDSIPTGVFHPRFYGNFPLYLGKYVRDKKSIPLIDAIYKATYLPCKTLGLSNRGLIKESFLGDITIFDYEKIKGYEDYKNTKLKPEGIVHVILKGHIAIKNGKLNKKAFGEVILPFSS